MSREDEINAYVELVCATTPKGIVLLKPHPREEPAKIDELEVKLARSGYKIVNLGSIGELTVYPIEAILLCLQCIHDVHVIATTSAAYGVAMTCGILPTIGFGRSLVQRYFALDFRQMRLEHEKLLSRYSNAFLGLQRKWESGIDSRTR